MRDVNSFVNYFDRQKRPESMIYASLDPAKIFGVIDDHPVFNIAFDDEHEGANDPIAATVERLAILSRPHRRADRDNDSAGLIRATSSMAAPPNRPPARTFLNYAKALPQPKDCPDMQSIGHLGKTPRPMSGLAAEQN